MLLSNIALLLETDQFVIINNDEGKIIDLSILSNHFNNLDKSLFRINLTEKNPRLTNELIFKGLNEYLKHKPTLVGFNSPVPVNFFNNSNYIRHLNIKLFTADGLNIQPNKLNTVINEDIFVKTILTVVPNRFIKMDSHKEMQFFINIKDTRHYIIKQETNDIKYMFSKLPDFKNSVIINDFTNDFKKLLKKINNKVVLGKTIFDVKFTSNFLIFFNNRNEKSSFEDLICNYLFKDSNNLKEIKSEISFVQPHKYYFEFHFEIKIAFLDNNNLRKESFIRKVMPLEQDADSEEMVELTRASFYNQYDNSKINSFLTYKFEQLIWGQEPLIILL